MMPVLSAQRQSIQYVGLVRPHSADHVVDIGPGAGVHGGHIVAEGPPAAIERHPASLTGQYLSARRRIPVPASRVAADPGRVLRLEGARANNLKNVTLELPLGLMTCVTGVSGSGKSTLINDTLYPVAARALNKANLDAAPHDVSFRQGCVTVSHPGKLGDREG